jgi:NAD(P)-dependent dehydrogenase (short-subunit alcohol dehydrogenase family)
MASTNDRTAIITGGSRGLGRNTSLNLARRGVDIIFTYHSNSAEAQSMVREVETLGRKAAALQLDSSNVKAFDDFAQQVGMPGLRCTNHSIKQRKPNSIRSSTCTSKAFTF